MPLRLFPTLSERADFSRELVQNRDFPLSLGDPFSSEDERRAREPPLRSALPPPSEHRGSPLPSTPESAASSLPPHPPPPRCPGAGAQITFGPIGGGR